MGDRNENLKFCSTPRASGLLPLACLVSSQTGGGAYEDVTVNSGIPEHWKDVPRYMGDPSSGSYVLNAKNNYEFNLALRELVLRSFPYLLWDLVPEEKEFFVKRFSGQVRDVYTAVHENISHNGPSQPSTGPRTQTPYQDDSMSIIRTLSAKEAFYQFYGKVHSVIGHIFVEDKGNAFCKECYDAALKALDPNGSQTQLKEILKPFHGSAGFNANRLTQSCADVIRFAHHLSAFDRVLLQRRCFLPLSCFFSGLRNTTATRAPPTLGLGSENCQLQWLEPINNLEESDIFDTVVGDGSKRPLEKDGLLSVVKGFLAQDVGLKEIIDTEKEPELQPRDNGWPHLELLMHLCDEALRLSKSQTLGAAETAARILKSLARAYALGGSMDAIIAAQQDAVVDVFGLNALDRSEVILTDPEAFLNEYEGFLKHHAYDNGTRLRKPPQALGCQLKVQLPVHPYHAIDALSESAIAGTLKKHWELALPPPQPTRSTREAGGKSLQASEVAPKSAAISSQGLLIPSSTATVKRSVEPGLETIDIPAPPKRVFPTTALTPVSVLPEWAQVAFPGVSYFNPIQSQTLPVAFGCSDNFLVSAPTGAGKTNVALLAILQQIGLHMEKGGKLPSGKHFKVVYVAPMKSLVVEIVKKYTDALAPLGVNVHELTADIQLSRRELEAVHLIVTVPEKWDILTRNTPSGGISTEESLLTSLAALIIDEVHLLNDDRGPIIEAIVARTLRYMEASQKRIRLVGISATLPNWYDIATFLRVAPEHVFHFDGSFRPVPLQQTLIGITEKSVSKRADKLNSVCYEKVVENLASGFQVMVFVHARNETRLTAEGLIDLARENNRLALFDVRREGGPPYAKFEAAVERSRDQTLRRLFSYAVGVHHAGMLRADRILAEQMFAEGVLQVLVCTATLAWGVNLPAHCVIIKGTTLFDSKSGGFRDVGILDILQIFGRAGRPQFDTWGHAVLITTSSQQLQRYWQLLTHQTPIESQFLKNIANALNAEICIGTVTNEHEGTLWLAYTYLFVRLFKSPISYGINKEQFENDPDLTEFRRYLISQIGDVLEEARLIRINRTDGRYFPTDVGRIAARYYVDYETARSFREQLGSSARGLSHHGILNLLGQAQEFQNLKVRQEELPELVALSRYAKYPPPPEKVDTIPGKVALLVQAYLDRSCLVHPSLVSDSHYIQQNAPRLMRALLEISLSQATVSQKSAASTFCIVQWSTMLERCLWHDTHILRHFCYPGVFNNISISQRSKKGGFYLKEDTVKALEKKGLDYWRVLDMTVAELKDVVRIPHEAKMVHTFLRKVPKLNVELRVQPLTLSIIRIILNIVPDFDWDERFSGVAESFRIWVENPETERLWYCEDWSLTQNAMQNLSEPICVSFFLPLPCEDETPAQYLLHIVSDRWVKVWFVEEFSIKHLLAGLKAMYGGRSQLHTPLLDLHPIPVNSLQNASFERLYTFKYFNPIQSQIFHTCYWTDTNVLLGAPTGGVCKQRGKWLKRSSIGGVFPGSGKTVAAELAIFRLLRESPHRIAVYIAPLKALAKERLHDWEERIGRRLGKRVSELTGDSAPDATLLHTSSVLITTPEKWDGVSRFWRHRRYVQKVGLIIIDEIHLLGMDRGPTLEAIVSRMRYITRQALLDTNGIRFVGLSTALSNAYDVAEWLGVDREGYFNFSPSVRPVPCTTHVSAYPDKHYCPRMASMNKPAYQAIQTYSPRRPVLIFVASRRQTRLTALDLMGLSAADDETPHHQFLNIPDEDEFAEILASVKDETLKRTLEFGIGIHHAGLHENDRAICEELFRTSKIQILITTATLAWGVNLPAHLVIVKGTEVYDAQARGYVDMPMTDVLQMIGRAGRPQFDTTAVACVFVYSPKKDFYKRFLYEPFPVESNLIAQLDDHLNAEICSGTICTRADAVRYLTWTYFFRRLTVNPAYYLALEKEKLQRTHSPLRGFGTKRSDPKSDPGEILKEQREKIVEFVDTLIDATLKNLETRQCVTLTRRFQNDEIQSLEEKSEKKKDAGTVSTDVLVTSDADQPKHAAFIKAQCGSLSLCVEPTYSGRIAALHYISTSTVAMLNERLISSTNTSQNGIPLTWIDLAKLLCSCQEYAALPVRHNEDLMNAQFSLRCPILLDTNLFPFSSPHTKAFLLLQSHFFNIPLPITDYVTDRKMVLSQAVRIVFAIADLAAEKKQFTTVLNTCLLLQSLIQASHPYRSPLVTLLRKPLSKILPSTLTLPPLHELIEVSEKQQKNILRSSLPTPSSEDTVVSIVSILKELPRIRLSIDCEVKSEENNWIPIKPSQYPDANKQLPSHRVFRLPEGPFEDVRLRFSILCKNVTQACAYAPQFPRKTAIAWALLAADQQTDRLLHYTRIQRFSPPHRKPPVATTPASEANAKQPFQPSDGSTQAEVTMILPSNEIAAIFSPAPSSNALPCERMSRPLSLLLCSLCYMGLDQEMRIVFLQSRSTPINCHSS